MKEEQGEERREIGNTFEFPRSLPLSRPSRLFHRVREEKKIENSKSLHLV